jgi:hypothetical protein
MCNGTDKSLVAKSGRPRGGICLIYQVSYNHSALIPGQSPGTAVCVTCIVHGVNYELENRSANYLVTLPSPKCVLVMVEQTSKSISNTCMHKTYHMHRGQI